MTPESYPSLHMDGHGMYTCHAPAISAPHTHRSPKNIPSICGHAKVRDLQSGSEPVCHFEQLHLKNWEKSKGLVGVPTKMANRKAVCNYKFCLLENVRPRHWCSRVVVRSHVNKTPPLATEWKKPCTSLVRDQMAFFFFFPLLESHPRMIKNQTQILSLEEILSLPSEGAGKRGSSLKETHSDWWVATTWSKVVMLRGCCSSSPCWPQVDPRKMSGASRAAAPWAWASSLSQTSVNASNQNRHKTGPPWLWLTCQAEICLNEKGNWNR